MHFKPNEKELVMTDVLTLRLNRISISVSLWNKRNGVHGRLCYDNYYYYYLLC